MADPEDSGTEGTLQSGPTLPSSFGAGRYVPEKLLGVGGQKIVYLVEDKKLERRCALSIMSDRSLGEAHRERFEREARAMARLGAHPNVVAVFDVGEEAGRPFIVSELVGGGDLRDRLRDGRLAPERAISIAKDVLDALVFVHKSGLVHRDLKPDNVWLTDDGRAKLGDFGIALITDRPRLSIAGSLLGTPAYMAPEQVQGDRVDARADLYALGAMLHELVTGRPLFEGPVMAVLSQKMYSKPTPVSELAPSVPKGLESFILRLLAKSPDERPASAEQARAELDRASAGGAAPATAHDPLRALFHAAFVGRDGELATLKAAFERAQQGRPALTLLAGEPGIGKTRLCQELALHARLRGARVLIGRCSEADGAPPYLPFADALESFLSTETLDALQKRLGHDTGTLRELLPRSVGRLGEVSGEEPRIDRHVLFQAVTDLVRGIAGSSGLVLILEDLHWADKASLLLLKHLFENSGTAPIAIVATYRDAETGRQHPLSTLLGDLRRNPAVARITLHGLALDHVRALVGTVSAATDWSADFAVKLREKTEGNPLFVQEVLKKLVENGAATSPPPRELVLPEGVREVIGQRLARLGEACNRMLARASVIGAAFEWELLVATAGEAEDTLLDLLDEALASQIIREKKQGRGAIYEFSHALIRQTLYESLNTPRRARVHRQVADAILRLHASSLDDHVVELADHFFHSGSAAEAVEYCTRAGDRALLQVGYEKAIEHYTRALETVDALDADEPTKQSRLCDLHARRARAFAMNAAHEDARSELDRAFALTTSDVRRVELLVERCAACQMLMDIPGVARAADEILRVVEPLSRADLKTAGLIWRAVAHTAEGDVARSIVDCEAAVSGGIRGAPLFALGHYPLTLYWAGRYQEALDWSDRILEEARRQGDATAAMMTLPHRALALACLCRYGEALATFREGRELAERHGHRGFGARMVSMSGGTYLTLLDYEQAEALADEARTLGRAAPFQPPVISSGFDLAFIATRRGDFERARALLEEVTKPAETSGAWHGWVWRLRLDELRAELSLREGDPNEAIDAATRALERATRSGRPRYRVASRCIRGAALTALGKDGSEELATALAEARATQEPPVILHAMRASLAVRGDEALRAEAKALVHRIASAHPDAVTRARLLERSGVQ
jgi:tetratricopeptide (TPR) repeat protein